MAACTYERVVIVYQAPRHDVAYPDPSQQNSRDGRLEVRNAGGVHITKSVLETAATRSNTSQTLHHRGRYKRGHVLTNSEQPPPEPAQQSPPTIHLAHAAKLRVPSAALHLLHLKEKQLPSLRVGPRQRQNGKDYAWPQSDTW